MLRQDACDGSAALLYPGLIVFVLLFGALVFDTLQLTAQQRELAFHADTVGRQALSLFDRDIYRATGTVVVPGAVANSIPYGPTAATEMTCTLETAPNVVAVTCTLPPPQRLFVRPFNAELVARRRLVAELVCVTCSTFDAPADEPWAYWGESRRTTWAGPRDTESERLWIGHVIDGF